MITVTLSIGSQSLMSHLGTIQMQSVLSISSNTSFSHNFLISLKIVTSLIPFNPASVLHSLPTPHFLKSLHDLQFSVVQKQLFILIFLDYSKAIDSVNHNILINKFQNSPLFNSIFLLLQSFLSYRPSVSPYLLCPRIHLSLFSLEFHKVHYSRSKLSSFPICSLTSFQSSLFNSSIILE